jgi:hypothetical protein
MFLVRQKIVVVVIVCVIFFQQQQSALASSSESTVTTSSISGSPLVTDPPTTKVKTESDSEMEESTLSSSTGNVDVNRISDINIVFSDLDGTLIHYPSSSPKNQRGNQLLKLPPSSTGMKGIISSKTLQHVQKIRNQGIKFVLVSGMRTSTFLTRLPYLPRADAYCTEAGGRIFYPIDNSSSSSAGGNALQELEASGRDVFIVKPKQYDGATKDELAPFAIEEDMQWRKNIEQVAGQLESPPLKELAKDPSKMKPLKARDGLLWDFARNLIHQGFELDTDGYSACFRVNRKQQIPTSVTDDDFNSLLDGRIRPFDGLASSINLSCVDYYPAKSGKRNW